MGYLCDAVGERLDDPAAAILEIDRDVTAALTGGDYPAEHVGVPLAGSLTPWIHTPVAGGQMR